MPKRPRAAADPIFNATDVEVECRQTTPAGRWQVGHFRVRHRRYRGGMTGWLDRDVVERGHAAAALPYDPIGDRVVLVEQFRLPAHRAGYPGWLLEVPAGVIEDGEAPLAVAIRECLEETGCAMTAPLPIATYLPSPGLASETVHLFCGRVASAEAPELAGLAAEDEETRVVVLPWTTARRALDQGRITNAATLIALHWLARHRTRLRRRWPEIPPP
jgi:ADP-ribose pyrophosphatase